MLAVIESRIPPLTADELHEQLRAEVRLSQIELFEDLAELHDTEPSVRLRAEFAERYRRGVGVYPALRQEFKAAMERIVAGVGNRPIADIIESLESRH